MVKQIHSNNLKSFMVDKRRTILFSECDSVFETETTYEQIGFSTRFDAIHETNFAEAGLSLAYAYDIFENAMAGKSDKIVGTYNIGRYTGMFAAIQQIADNLTIDKIESRQFSVVVEANHCFQSIQLLIRENDIYAIANMRSCNLEVNFLLDAFLTYKCGTLLAAACFNKNLKKINAINLIMNIGSFHIFKGPCAFRVCNESCHLYPCKERFAPRG